MRITELKISNFRSFDTETMVTFPSAHLALVGRNNAGKSNLLTAMEWVLGRTSAYRIGQRLEEADYFNSSQPIVITATLGHIEQVDKQSLMPLATNNKQRGALSSKDNPEIKVTLALPAWNPESEDDDDSAEPLRASLSISLWGFPVHRKTDSVKSALIQVLKVSSERSVGDDLSASQWTPYGQLMKTVLEAAPEYKELEDLLGQVNTKIQAAFASEKQALLTNAQVASYVDDIEFQLTRRNDPVELLRSLQIIVSEGGHPIPLELLGSGTQSVLIIAMLEIVLRSRTGQAKLFAIEEPDAFLHPHGIRHLAGLIRRIGEERNAQVVLSTHSPSLLATLTPGDLARVEKVDGASVIHQSPGTLSDPEFSRFVNADNAEMFFASRVIFVEGATERFLLPPLSRLINKDGQSFDFDERQISVVELQGKNSVTKFLKIAHAFDIDARAILDNDFLGDTSCKTLVAYLRTRGNSIDDSSDASLRSSLWAAGVLVLKRGEIENYIPESDVAAITGKSLSDVQTALAATSKASDVFKKLFATTKPLYARLIAEHYTQLGTVPNDLEKLIAQVS